MAGDTLIRAAMPPERAALEALQLRSSLHSGTYAERLRAHPEVVRLPAGQIEAGLVRVAERDGALAGFAVLLGPDRGEAELDGLFVEPSAMRAGVGRCLVADAAAIARAAGATRIAVVANPDATAFYARVGFVDDGAAQTRFGPARRMRLEL